MSTSPATFSFGSTTPTIITQPFEGYSCDKPGHFHHWPIQGTLVIERCEHYCLFCTGEKASKRWSSAWFLRRHIRTAHATEGSGLEVPEGWAKCPNGNARPLVKRRPPPGANCKRNKQHRHQATLPQQAHARNTTVFTNTIPVGQAFNHTHAFNFNTVPGAFTPADYNTNAVQNNAITFDMAVQPTPSASSSVVGTATPDLTFDFNTPLNATPQTFDDSDQALYSALSSELATFDQQMQEFVGITPVVQSIEPQPHTVKPTFVAPQDIMLYPDAELYAIEPQNNFNVDVDFSQYLMPDQLIAPDDTFSNTALTLADVDTELELPLFLDVDTSSFPW